MKFMELYLEGKVKLEDIDDYVDIWHNSDSEEEIYDFLGMTCKQFAVYVVTGNLEGA